MNKKRVASFILAGFLILQASCVYANENLNAPKHLLQANKSFTARNYILGPNDVISVSIYNVTQFNQENIKIQPDGNAVITPLGLFKVAGLKIDELNNLLIDKFKYYLKDPQVAIKLVESKPFTVYITGAVANPGSYELNINTSNNQNGNSSRPEIQIDRKTPLLSNVLVAAGGISYDADLEHVQIKNSIDGSNYELNMLDLLEKGDSNQDIYLVAGDTVNVPKLPTPLAVSEEKYKKYASATFSPHVIPVRVMGYVNKPGLVEMNPAQSLKLNSAISLAGGYLNDAAYAPKNVFVSRLDTNGKLVSMVVNPMNMDITLMPDDIVYVPEKTRPLIGKAFDYAERILSPVSSVANSYNNWALMFCPTRYQVVGK